MTDDFTTHTASVNVSPQPEANVQANVATKSTNNTAPLIKDSSIAEFQTDVIDASATVPVLVDFWAPWCGPCKQLGPELENLVTEASGNVRLVKINIDENQQLASQMGVKSIPAVFAFSNGQPVDGFMGALPQSELRAFIDKQIGANPKDSAKQDLEAQIENALQAAEQALQANDVDQAINIYGQVLNQVPDHSKTLCALTKAFLISGANEQAAQALGLVPEQDHKSPEYIAANTALKLAAEASDLDETGEIAAKIDANPNDMQARMDLAVSHNASGNHQEAASALIEIIKRDREWQDDAGRTKLLEFFDAWGPTAPATIQGRKLLSRTLFS